LVVVYALPPRRSSDLGALIEALHKVQEIFGYVGDDAIILLANLFNLTRADVYGVVSFYHDFKRERPGRYTIKVCQAEACQAVGRSEEHTSELQSRENL